MELNNSISKLSMLKAYITDTQQSMGSYSLKRGICRQFKLKRFADLKEEQAEAAYQWLAQEVATLLPLWKSARLSEAVTKKLCAEAGIDDSSLQWRLTHRFREFISAEMNEDEAYEAIIQQIGKQNLYEIAFKPKRDQ